MARLGAARSILQLLLETRQQEELLDRLLELRDAADSSAAAATGSVEHIVSEVGQLISDLPGTSNEPRVYRVSATPYVPNWTETVTLVLRGVNLDRPDNYLEIGGTRLEPTSTSATAAEFTIPADRIAEYFDSSATGVQQQRGTITLHYRSGLFRRERSKQQFVALTAVPRNLGAASVVFTSTTSLANTQRFTSYVCAKGTRGPGWRGGAREESQSCQINAPVNPVGCKGQPQTGTIVGNPVLRTIANRHGGGAQITSLGQHSFTIAVTARSSSRPGGGGGLYAAEASYDVAFPCAVPREERSTPMQIRIGVDTTFTLPRDRESRFVNLELTMVDSSRHVLRGARAANRFISIEHASGTVIIRPIRVERN